MARDLQRDRSDTRHWLCRWGFHKWGWTGVGGHSGRMMRCERGYGVRAVPLEGFEQEARQFGRGVSKELLPEPAEPPAPRPDAQSAAAQMSSLNLQIQASQQSLSNLMPSFVPGHLGAPSAETCRAVLAVLGAIDLLEELGQDVVMLRRTAIWHLEATGLRVEQLQEWGKAHV